MVYQKQIWVDSPSTASPITAARLTHLEDGVYAASQAPVVPLWRAGRYYGARAVFAHGAALTRTLTANLEYAALVYVPADVTVTTIACNVADAIAGSKLRMGIRVPDPTGLPATLVAGSQTGDISATTAGLKTATISAPLVGGQWHWLTLASDAAIGVTGFVAGTVISPSVLGETSPATSDNACSVQASIGAGWTVLPASYPGSPTVTSTTLAVEVKF